MHRCFVEPAGWKRDIVVPSSSELHHLTDVMRAEVGEEITVFDGRGRQASALIRKTDEAGVFLELIEKTQDASPTTRIVLIQALPRSKKMDLIVEKGTELGAGAIWPVATERTLLRLDRIQAAKKLDRWRRIAGSAAKQCGTNWIPDIQPLHSLQEALNGGADLDLLLLASLSSRVKPLHEVLAAARPSQPRSIGIIIGPEGDFTPGEIEMCITAGARPVTFGALVLRVETAAIHSLSILAYEYLWR